MRRVHSLLSVLLNLSIIAMLPCFPAAPWRRLIPFRLHQSRNPSQKNCPSLSVMRCPVALPALRMARPKKERIAYEPGFASKTITPCTRREKLSMTTATHQQKGHACGTAKGIQTTQNPEVVGTAVRSTCQTWSGPLAFNTGPTRTGSWSAGKVGFAPSILFTVVGPR